VGTIKCLPLELAAARKVLRQQASLEFGRRWSRVRSVVTSRDLMSGLAELAGWKVLLWYAGDEASSKSPGLGSSISLLLYLVFPKGKEEGVQPALTCP
jgi:hypothetical protein